MNPIMNLLLLGIPIDTRPYHERFPQEEEDDKEEETKEDTSPDIF